MLKWPFELNTDAPSFKEADHFDSALTLLLLTETGERLLCKEFGTPYRQKIHGSDSIPRQREQLLTKINEQLHAMKVDFQVSNFVHQSIQGTGWYELICTGKNQGNKQQIVIVRVPRTRFPVE